VSFRPHRLGARLPSTYDSLGGRSLGFILLSAPRASRPPADVIRAGFPASGSNLADPAARLSREVIHRLSARSSAGQSNPFLPGGARVRILPGALHAWSCGAARSVRRPLKAETEGSSPSRTTSRASPRHRPGEPRPAAPPGHKAPSSSGPGCRPFKARGMGSNPIGATAEGARSTSRPHKPGKRGFKSRLRYYLPGLARPRGVMRAGVVHPRPRHRRQGTARTPAAGGNRAGL
jgi:hypothetical protein